MSDITDRENRTPLDVITEPATYRRPLGVIDADTKRADRAAAGARVDAAGDGAIVRLAERIAFGCMTALGLVFIGWIELRAAGRRAMRRLRRARPDQLDPDVLAQLRANARRLAVQKSSTRSDP